MQPEFADVLDFLADELVARADNLRIRAIQAESERGGAVADEVVDRWASSFATAYQTLSGLALACKDTADILVHQAIDRAQAITREQQNTDEG